MDKLINENGAVWCYGVKKGGQLSKSGSRLTQEEADRRVTEGEAEWLVAPSTTRELSRSERRESYERDIQGKADRGVLISAQDWSAAMNRDS